MPFEFACIWWRKAFKESIAVRKTQCTRLKKALITKLEQSRAGRIFLWQLDLDLSLLPTEFHQAFSSLNLIQKKGKNIIFESLRFSYLSATLLYRLSQCSASLQALLALTPTALHALSKLVMNNSESSDDIISVMRNIVGQFQTKTQASDNEGIDVSLSVRLWKISGFHEMLASLGFDLMDVGQDQVTLRTGKQANKRNCQFVLQSLLALFTQEAPKTIGMDSASSSSTESLNEAAESDIKLQKQRRDQNLVGSAYLNFPRPLIAPRKMTTSSRSAFISYQKRRGEPDGGHEDAIQQQKLQPTFETTDSELSDGYATQKMLAKYSGKDAGFGGLRRHQPGGESDAAFTPSPVENNVSLALAHQTKIRNLYTNINEAISTGAVSKNGSRRPDSSSSSATDWDSGHATVLRRANNVVQGATLPLPRQLLPIVDNLRPTAPVYNNLLVQCGMKKSLGMLESTSSDSEGWMPSQTRNKIKLHQQYIQQSHQQQHQANSHYQDIPAMVSVAKIKEQFNFIDRLSVRTEASKANGGHRKSILKSNDDVNLSGNSLYFSPAELQNTTTNLVEDDSGPSSVIHHPPTHNHHKIKESKSNLNPANGSTNTQQPTKKTLQDSIMRHMNREMAPAISDAYHERNIGLISAPPLSKLLMTNYEENENANNVQPPMSSSPTSGLNKLMNAIDLSEEITNCTSTTAKLLSCGGASNSDEDFSVEDEAASSQATMKSAPKKKSFSSVPWLSSINTENIVKPSDLTTAEILEHQKIKSTSSSSSNSELLSVLKSPYSEFRDDADGHSQCSSTPKNSLPSQQIRNNIY